METKIYRIDGSLVGKIFRALRKTDTPGPRNIATASMPMSNLIRGIKDFTVDENIYLIDDMAELNKFDNALGNNWIQKTQYYIRHPKVKRERLLIEAEQFHEYIYREQLSEIVSYLRSEFKLKYLKIEVIQGNKFSSYSNLPIERMSVEGEVKLELKNERVLEIKSTKGMKRSEKRIDYVWLNDFRGLLDAVDNFDEGDFRYSQKINNTLDINSKLYKVVGIDLKWKNTSTFEIEFSV